MVDFERETMIGELPKLAELITFGNFHEQFTAMQTLRRFVSKVGIDHGPFQEVVDFGIIPLIVRQLNSANHLLQFQSTWALSNIAAEGPNETFEIIKNGSLPILVRLMRSDDDDVKEQAVWALGNIAGHEHAAEHRDMVIAEGALPRLLELINDSKTNIDTLRVAARTLANFCNGKSSPPNWDEISTAMPSLASLIEHYDTEVLVSACWGISDIYGGSQRRLEAVVESGVCPRLVKLLGHYNVNVVYPALQAIRHFTGVNDEQAQVVINCDGLPALRRLLNCTNVDIRSQTCWTIANLTAGNHSQIQAVMDEDKFPILMRNLEEDQMVVKKEANCAISNACASGNSNQVNFLAKNGCIKHICDMIEHDPENISTMLLGLKNILMIGEEAKNTTGGVNEMIDFFKYAGGLEKIYDLQLNDSIKIRDLATDILHYFR
ncbi:Importin alpha subunit (Karyopherin alpha subunit) (Serine-rich RNA polymerase I suppressor protein) [Nowakowskiella sp. JEL0407]|nr:Importin alpha subunit (Karyopherin alpha subunit) (Serine-rich RNA polymerase I suppressor protein) [Nowakowskiella sp. JEL0407]